MSKAGINSQGSGPFRGKPLVSLTLGLALKEASDSCPHPNLLSAAPNPTEQSRQTERTDQPQMGTLPHCLQCDPRFHVERRMKSLSTCRYEGSRMDGAEEERPSEKGRAWPSSVHTAGDKDHEGPVKGQRGRRGQGRGPTGGGKRSTGLRSLTHTTEPGTETRNAGARSGFLKDASASM